MKSLDFIAWAWPAEVAIISAYALAGPAFLSTVWYDLFLRGLPLLTALIAGQGAVAFFGKAEK